METADWSESNWQCQHRYAGALANLKSTEENDFIERLLTNHQKTTNGNTKFENIEESNQNHFFNRVFFADQGFLIA